MTTEGATPPHIRKLAVRPQSGQGPTYDGQQPQHSDTYSPRYFRSDLRIYLLQPRQQHHLKSNAKFPSGRAQSISNGATTPKAPSTTPPNKASGHAFRFADPPVYIVRPVPMTALSLARPRRAMLNPCWYGQTATTGLFEKVVGGFPASTMHPEGPDFAHFATGIVASLLKL